LQTNLQKITKEEVALLRKNGYFKNEYGLSKTGKHKKSKRKKYYAIESIVKKLNYLQ
jgi:hypothetical protein